VPPQPGPPNADAVCDTAPTAAAPAITVNVRISFLARRSRVLSENPQVTFHCAGDIA
jgi:hypothetical protein